MEKNSRRIFLGKSLLGISSLAFLPKIETAYSKPLIPEKNQGKSLTRVLGRTGIRLPLISMGTGDTQNSRLVRAAYDAGVKLFSTSSYYGEGNNEKMLGELFKNFPRDSFYVSTASTPLGINHKEGIFTDPKAGPRYVKDIEDGLMRLKLDHVDIIYLAFAAKRESVFFEPLMRAMDDLRKSGKTRFIGIATHSFCDEAIRAAADAGIYDVVMTAYNFKNEKDNKLKEAIDYAVKAGLGIVAMKTTAGAYWDRERKVPVNTHAALKWVLQNENITSVVSGMTGYEELEKNLLLNNDYKLTREELTDLKLAFQNPSPGLYCTQCHQCVRQCRKGLDIPNLMRGYMYAYGYRNFPTAKKALSISGIDSLSCSECRSCTVQCSRGFDVPGKIRDIVRINDIPSEFLFG
ncbi:MAG TPA: aldo/keto reductase [Cyclobacteriaceae bacterium]|nr:aldo/keto reductase [Cyclobacteriaceae bacterium]